ncbi:MAG TPA: hypothetical protein VGG76_10655 [Gemmatimonadaceae bacterium]
MPTQTTKNTGYRTFLDPRGRRWEVWMVHPSSIERRKMERRTPTENAINLIEQRVLGDRRVGVGSRGAVATEYSAGWLCFASGGEKRRLAPVPVNWISANDGQVAEWCRIAKRVVKCGPTWDPEDELDVPRSTPTRADSGRRDPGNAGPRRGDPDLGRPTR